MNKPSSGLCILRQGAWRTSCSQQIARRPNQPACRPEFSSPPLLQPTPSFFSFIPSLGHGRLLQKKGFHSSRQLLSQNDDKDKGKDKHKEEDKGKRLPSDDLSQVRYNCKAEDQS
jgi:hypothetical protein